MMKSQLKQIMKNDNNSYKTNNGSEISECDEMDRYSKTMHLNSGSKLDSQYNKSIFNSQQLNCRKVTKSGTHHNILHHDQTSNMKSILQKSSRSKTFHQIMKVKNNPDNKSNYLRNVVYNYGLKSRSGENMDGSHKQNQDNYFMKLKFMNDKNMNLFGVMDGHGQDGHLVSQFIKSHLPSNIEKMMNEMQDMKDIDMKVEQSLESGFRVTADQLSQAVHIDSQYSGSTISMVLIIGDIAYFANLGDSRSIIINHEQSEYNCSYQTEDQKPEHNQERLRIEQSGGRVCPTKGQTEPLRVWLKKDNIPGLAMTRSMGDFLCSSIGVINQPQIDKIHLHQTDVAIIIASDGIWEFIQSEQVPVMVSSHIKSNNPDQLCEFLVQEAFDQWKSSQCNIDDITILTVFIKL